MSGKGPIDLKPNNSEKRSLCGIFDRLKPTKKGTKITKPVNPKNGENYLLTENNKIEIKIKSLEEAAKRLELEKKEKFKSFRVFYDRNRETLNQLYFSTRKQHPEVDTLHFLNNLYRGMEFLGKGINPHSTDPIEELLGKRGIQEEQTLPTNLPQDIILAYKIGELAETKEIPLPVLNFLIRFVIDSVDRKEKQKETSSTLLESSNLEALLDGLIYVVLLYQKQMEHIEKKAENERQNRALAAKKREEIREEEIIEKRKIEHRQLEAKVAKANLITLIEAGRTLRIAQESVKPAKNNLFLARIFEGIFILFPTSASPVEELLKIAGDNNLPIAKRIYQILMFYSFGKIIESIINPPEKERVYASLREFVATNPMRAIEIFKDKDSAENFVLGYHYLSGAEDVETIVTAGKFAATIKTALENEKPRVLLQNIKHCIKDNLFIPVDETYNFLSLSPNLTKTKKTEILRHMLLKSRSEAIPILLSLYKLAQHDTFFTAPKEKETEIASEIKQFISEIILEISQSRSDEVIPKVLNHLLNSISTSVGGEEIDPLEIEKKILTQVSAAGYHVAKEHTKIYSPVRAMLDKVLGFCGIRTEHAIKIQKLEAIIEEVTKTPEGQIEALKYLAAAKISNLKISPDLASKVIKNILMSSENLTVNCNPARSLVLEIAKVNELSKKTASPKTATAILEMALLLAELAKEEPSEEISKIVTEVFILSDKSRLKIPEPNTYLGFLLAKTGLNAINNKESTEPLSTSEKESLVNEVKVMLESQLEEKTKQKISFPSVAESLIIFATIKASENDFILASKKIKILKNNENIWGKLLAESKKFALNIFTVRYAHSFLAFREGLKIDELEELRSIIISDRDQRQLFLTLQTIPAVIEGQLLNNYGQSFEQIGETNLFLELQVFWNLLQVGNLDPRLSRREIAARIIDVIRNRWDKGELWGGIIELAKRNRFDIIQKFFAAVIANIMERGKTMDPKLGKQEGNIIHLIIDPFDSWNIGMALRACEETIFRELKDQPQL